MVIIIDVFLAQRWCSTDNVRRAEEGNKTQITELRKEKKGLEGIK